MFFVRNKPRGEKVCDHYSLADGFKGCFSVSPNIPSGYCFYYAMRFLPILISSGSMAEWSKGLVLGTSLSGGMGSNPTAAKFHFVHNEKLGALSF